MLLSAALVRLEGRGDECMTYLALETGSAEIPQGELEAAGDAVKVHLEGDKSVGKGHGRCCHDVDRRCLR